MMGVFQEFKKFALRGSVIDMAVGIIIGAAFGTVVKSLVDDVIMPPIGLLTSGAVFRDASYTLREQVEIAGENGTTTTLPAITLNYGAFINNAITFLIVAWSVFLLVKAMNIAEERLRLGEQPPAETPLPPEDIVLLREIRDSLKHKSPN
jgi:large conductance mechanosensitive channel